uniref:Uncharacterized protein n=1 Tax=Glossina brevipalpis TaxID=37001 RepID=A0A1A9WXY7_9MUSC
MGTNFGMDDDDVENPFKDQLTRKQFIRKVYLTLFMQLLLTSGIVAIFVCIDAVAFYVHENYYLKWIALGLEIVLILVLICCESIRRSTPTNYICLLLFTFCNGFLMGVMASLYAPDEVLASLGITGAVVLALTLFAMQMKIDFTPLYCIMLIITVIFILFSLVAMFFFQNRILRIVYAAIGVTIFSIWLIIDTQMIMGGRRLSIDTDEYIFAALQLYIDIVMIFQYILILFSDS